MSFTLKTLNNPQRDSLTKIFSQFELSNNQDSSCFELDKSEDLKSLAMVGYIFILMILFEGQVGI